MSNVLLYTSKILLKQILLDILHGLHLCLNIHVTMHFTFVKICTCLPLREYNILLS